MSDCNSCKKGLHEKDCHDTPKLIQINNNVPTLMRRVEIPASVADDRVTPPVNGQYRNTLLVYEATGNAYLFSSDGIYTKVLTDGAIDEEAKARTDADDAIWAEIEEIEMSSDVVDIVGTYAELQQYDTTHLKDNDIIKVLSDETHQNETAYYRWSTATDNFSYVGSEGPYYTESEVDALLSGKQDTLIAGSNIQIAADGKTISATDTTYTHFTGATASTDGVQGLVPGPLAGDEGKFLSGDGTWQNVQGASYTAGNGINISAQDEISIDTTVVAELSDLPSVMTGATSGTAGTSGLVPAPSAGDQSKVLKGDGTWGEAAANTVFYADSSAIGSTRSIYKDAAMTTAASMQDIIDANEKGQVILRTTSTVDPSTYSDAYLQNAWVTSGDYQMLFLDEKKYSEYHSTTASATTFNYESRELQDKLTAGTNVTITGTTISATDTTYSAFGGATSSVAGSAGLVPAPTTSDPDKYLKGDGTWATLPGANNISSNDWSALWQ